VVLANGTMLNLMLYKREPGILQSIKNANYVANFTAQAGLPARRTADKRIILLYCGDFELHGALYEYLPGQTIPWEAYTKEHIKNLGQTMSDMHAALRPLPRRGLPLVTDECQALANRMSRYCTDAGVQTALAAKLGLRRPPFKLNFAPYQKLPGHQALHLDFVRGNILFNQNAQITGILDFEKTAWGPPVFDIARTLAFLLIDCKYKEAVKVRKYFLHSGYNKRGRSALPGLRLLEPLITFYLLHDFYKFLRHNPYEYLPGNEHFVRTRDLLLKRNIIGMVK
jgi:Ser/Thr protein kinase RdoA (MazF antagonist)